MQIVTGSAEYHLLTVLEKIRAAPRGWDAQHFALSKLLSHDDLISDLTAISAKIAAAHAKSEAFAGELGQRAAAFRDTALYVFADTDVLLLTHSETDAERQNGAAIFSAMSDKFPLGIADQFQLTHELYQLQKFADQKLLSAKRFKAYEVMTDTYKIASIAVRRERREAEQVLLVEDDRFTASYTSNILSKDYDLIVARTGEEGLMAYIENAPEIVFMDIHLPGMSGIDTLSAINAIDPKAYVVMLSVDAVKESIVKASQGGARNFLKKPFSKERLLHIVKNSPHVLGFDLGKSENISQ